MSSALTAAAPALLQPVCGFPQRGVLKCHPCADGPLQAQSLSLWHRGSSSSGSSSGGGSRRLLTMSRRSKGVGALSVRASRRDEQVHSEAAPGGSQRVNGMATLPGEPGTKSSSGAALKEHAHEESPLPSQEDQNQEEQQERQRQHPAASPKNLSGSLRAEKERSALLARELREAQAKVRRQERILRHAIKGRALLGKGPLGNLAFNLREVGRAVEGAFGTPIGELLEEYQQQKLDIDAMRKEMSYTDFWPQEWQRYGNGASFSGNLRAPLEEVRQKLKEKLQRATGCELELFFILDDVTSRQVLLVQPVSDVKRQLAASYMSGVARWPYALFLLGATLFTTVSLNSVNLDPGGTSSDLLHHALPFTVGLGTVLGVGEISARLMAKKYGVKIGPPYFIPSGWLGCLGVATRFESVLPSRAALFDISAARAVGSWGAAFLLAVYVEPAFFQPNLLLSFIQYVIGPYTDELGNVLPHAVADVGIPVNPLAFSALVGLVVTSLNLLPAGQLEGGRIAQAIFGRRLAKRVSFITTTCLGIAGFTGSVLCLLWGFLSLFFRNGQELTALDEIDPVDKKRVLLGWLLLGGCLLMLLPNSAGTFPSTFFTPSPFLSDIVL
eukprot:jgi/Mesen1/4823/ME000243S04004